MRTTRVALLPAHPAGLFVSNLGCEQAKVRVFRVTRKGGVETFTPCLNTACAIQSRRSRRLQASIGCRLAVCSIDPPPPSLPSGARSS